MSTTTATVHPQLPDQPGATLHRAGGQPRDLHILRTVEEELYFAVSYDAICDRTTLAELLPWRVKRRSDGLSLLEARQFVNRRLSGSLTPAPMRLERISLSQANPHIFMNVERMWHVNVAELGLTAPIGHIKGSPNVLMPTAARDSFPSASRDSGFVTLYSAPRWRHPGNVVIDLALVGAPKCLIDDELTAERRLVVIGDIPRHAVRWVGPELRHGPWADKPLPAQFDGAHRWSAASEPEEGDPVERAVERLRA